MPFCFLVFQLPLGNVNYLYLEKYKKKRGVGGGKGQMMFKFLLSLIAFFYQLMQKLL